MSAFGGKADMLPTSVDSASDLKMAVVRTIRLTYRRKNLGAGAYSIKGGRYADLHGIDEFYRSGHPRYQRRPEACTSGERSREEVGRRGQGSISYVWRKRSRGFRRNAEWRQCREISAGAWLARQCPHPHMPRLAV